MFMHTAAEDNRCSHSGLALEVTLEITATVKGGFMNLASTACALTESERSTAMADRRSTISALSCGSKIRNRHGKSFP